MTNWKKRRDSARLEQARLRDEFAKAWMNGAASDPTTRAWRANAHSNALTAYVVADAMLKSRAA